MAEASIALNRFGLGGRPGDDPGRDPRGWLIDQLSRYAVRPEAIAAAADSKTIAADLADYMREQRALRQQGLKPAGPPTMPPASPSMTGGEAMQAVAPAAMPAKLAAGSLNPLTQARRMARREGRDYYTAAVSARAIAAIDSPTPFVERLVHFWANHFAVSADKLTTVGLSGTLEFEAIRPHVLGRFGDMLQAVERHPAMLLYLDQAQSAGPNSVAAQNAASRGRKLGLNENLAREILELHTLGVRTGYSQADVTAFARALTGWTVSGLGRGGAGAGAAGSFLFADRLHEPGVPTILGRQWPKAGEAQAASVLDVLAVHPATARHLATKLARHFAGDDPPPALVDRLSTAFLKSQGDLPTMYRALVEAPECWVAQPLKFKSPWEWGISAMRALGSQQVQAGAVNGLMNQLGQPVWKPGSPAGWDDVAGSWAGSDAVMRRVEAAERMAQRTRDTIDARSRAAELFPGALSAATTQAIARAESPSQGVALMLVSPEFMRR